MQDRDFADVLVEDLTPVSPADSWARTWIVWCVLSWILCVSGLLATGPFREGFRASLVSSPLFGLEFALGGATGLAAIWAGLEIGVPGTPRRHLLWIPALVFLFGWLGLLAFGLTSPSVEPSMSGMREFCFWETLAFAMPPLGLALAALRRRALLCPIAAGVLVGVGSAAIPALLMQIACMYDPQHVLTFHLGPLALAGALGGGLAYWIMPRP